MTHEEYLALLESGNAPATLRFAVANGNVAIKAAEKNDDGSRRVRRFTGRAYNGGVMTVGFYGDVVIDLQGLQVTDKQRPMLKDHNETTPVGHTVGMNGGNGVTIGRDFIDIEGLMSVDSPETNVIVGAADAGFEWQLSVGVNPTKLVFVDEDTFIEVNGQEFEGPLVVARESELKEISFLALGADDDTTSKVAARAAEFKKESEMTFKKWLKACNHDESKLSEGELKMLKATFEAIQAKEKQDKIEADKAAKIEAGKATPVAEPQAEPIKAQAVDVKSIVAEATKEIRAGLLEENKIATLCAGDSELHEQAIKAGWDSDRIQAEIKIKKLEAQRDSNVNGFSFSSQGDNAQVGTDIEIALLRAGGYSEEKIIKEYGEKAIQASDDSYGMRLGIQEAVSICARMNGYNGRAHSFRSDEKGMFRAAFSPIKASTPFATIGGLNGIFENVMGKRFQEGFMNVEQAWRDVTAIGSVNDFKKTEKFTLTGDFKFKPVGPGGELKTAKIGSEKYENQASTEGIKFGINRHDLINDDLDALSTVPNRMGRGSGIGFNEALWKVFLDNVAFYTVARKNLTSGAPLSVAELKAMNTAFRLQKDPDGNPMNAMASILLTGVENEDLAVQLHNDANIIIAGDTDRTVTESNPHRGKYRPVSSAYISDTTIGGSATQSYLLANPLDMAVIEAVFLRGRQDPIVESAEQGANFDTLGIDYRAYHDFGINLQEYRAGVKSVGA